jgi:guanylate kinase
MKLRADAISFFVHPGSREELEHRLRNRGTDTESAIKRRLEVAEEELTALSYYKHEIINRDLDRAVKEICDILEQYSGSKACLKS